MKDKQQDFVWNTREACRDLQNHFYSVAIKQNNIMPKEPLWMKKIKELEKNCTLFLNGQPSEVEWSPLYRAWNL